MFYFEFSTKVSHLYCYNLFFKYHILKLHDWLLTKPCWETWNINKIYHKCVEVIILLVTAVKQQHHLLVFKSETENRLLRDSQYFFFDNLHANSTRLPKVKLGLSFQIIYNFLFTERTWWCIFWDIISSVKQSKNKMRIIHCFNEAYI